MSEAAFEVAKFLTRSGSASPGPEARAIVAHVLGIAPGELLRITEVSSQQRAAIDELAKQRAQGVPLQHLTGQAHFRYETLHVGPGVFIPRPETELLAGWAIEQLASRPPGSRRVVELCAGSGAISRSIAREVGGVELFAVERSTQAYAYLARNLADTEAHLVLGDMAGALPQFDGAVDLVVANPPYIPHAHRVMLPNEVVDHDPAEALFAGEDGLAALRVVIQVAARLLGPGGLLGTEHYEDQAIAVTDMLNASGFSEVQNHLDLAGRPRYTTAIRVAGLAP